MATRAAHRAARRPDPHVQDRTATTGPGCRRRSRCTAGPSGCPTSPCCRRRTEEVAGVVRIANELRFPVVPRDGGTGLTDGAVPLRGGIVVDVKRMNKIHEIDLENRTCTVGTGINMLKLNEELARHGLIYPDDPASYPCSLVGGRIGTSGWSLIGSRYGHTRDLVLSFDHVLPTGEIIHVGDGIGRKITKSSSGYQLKHLFMGHQGTLGIATRATLKLFPKPEAELSPFWAFDNYDDAYACSGALARAGVATFAGAVLFDEYKVAYLRRDDEAYIPQPRRRPRAGVRGDVRLRGRGAARPGRRLMRIAREHGARYLGDEISEGDWAARHDRYATPAARADQGRPGRADELALRGRRDQLHQPARGHAASGTRSSPTCGAQTDVFDDWGMFAYTNGDTGVDYLTEIDVGIWEQQLDDAAWALWVKAKRDIAAVALALRRLDQRLPRLVPGGRGRPGAGGAGPRLRRDARRQADARPEQHHEPRQVPPGPRLRAERRRRWSARQATRSADRATGTPSSTRRPSPSGSATSRSPRSSTSSRSTRG